jgi:hypothetical protein
MANALPDDKEEKPLDPEMEKVRRKMVRLLAVSIGIMFVSLMAVLGAIVYKFTRPAEGPAPVASGVPSEAPVAGAIALPAGFAVEAMALDGDRVALFGRLADGSRRLIVHDAVSGRTISETTISERP